MDTILRRWNRLLPFVSLLFVTSCFTNRWIPVSSRSKVGVYHPIEKGETLWRICKTYGVDLQEVAEVNNIKDISQIKAGDRIFIPGATRVRTIETFVKEPDLREETIVQLRGKFSWPLRGEIVSHFGVREGIIYNGIDIHAPLGTPVKAADSGKVIYASALPGYGNLIIIEHKDRYTTLYGHNQENLVGEGVWVERESVIARVGNSHDPQALPTLHFQIRRYNKARNPLFYLK